MRGSTKNPFNEVKVRVYLMWKTVREYEILWGCETERQYEQIWVDEMCEMYEMCLI